MTPAAPADRPNRPLERSRGSFLHWKVVRACQEITSCTPDPRMVRCGRGSGHAAGETCGAVAGADGAVAPIVGRDRSAGDRVRGHRAGGAGHGHRGLDDSAGPARLGASGDALVATRTRKPGGGRKRAIGEMCSRPVDSVLVADGRFASYASTDGPVGPISFQNCGSRPRKRDYCTISHNRRL
jgi:hypothetical protein